MRKLHVGTSPLTNRIYAGHVLKDGATWEGVSVTPALVKLGWKGGIA